MPTILVVEDELSIATMLQDLLDEEGYTVVLARDGREALEQLPATRPALVITDLMMPGIDGLELCRAIQADPLYQTTPLILMSAIAKPSAADDCHYAAFLIKPLDLQVFLETISNVIGPAQHS
jgi:two-component system, OmpR family, response regulator VicR